MSTITGVVTNGVIVPSSPLPEGSHVEIHVIPGRSELAQRLTPGELRKLPREQRQAVLAAAAEMAEEDYRSDPELTGFDAFGEEELDDDQPQSR
jgi:hypothetical protein